jgi:putative AlgH/UPF0301 family transcriptional regulator
MLRRSSFLAAPTPSGINQVPSPNNALLRSAYRSLLKESKYFDSHPLAKALLSASPYLRKDSGWISVVNQPVVQPTNLSSYCGVPVNTLAMPSPKSMRQFVREEFRQADRSWDGGSRFFNWMKRIGLAKQLHERCSVSLPPELPPVTPKLQLTTDQIPASCDPGCMLFAHPVLVDDFTQAAILVVAKDTDHTVGVTLNSPCGSANFILNEPQLSTWISQSSRRFLKKANLAHFAKWPIFSGGHVTSAPFVLHKSTRIAKEIPGKIVSDDDRKRLPCVGLVHQGWYLHPLHKILALDPKIVKKELKAEHCRLIMNHCEWETATLQREVLQNWWLVTERKSSCKALTSLLEFPPPSQSEDENSGKVMWQRAVANLGGDLSDFSRLAVIQDEEGDYRKLITKTFEDDLKKKEAQEDR